jgi:tRNA(fMet)-specific endonuclease VapC
MTRYLIDTDVLIDLSKKRDPAATVLPRLHEQGDELGVSPINITEFYAGLQPRERAVWDEFFAALRLFPISPAAARQAGIWRYEFARRGTPLPTTDALIAAIAGEQQAVVLTRNPKDYPIAGLQLLVFKQER